MMLRNLLALFCCSVCVVAISPWTTRTAWATTQLSQEAESSLNAGGSSDLFDAPSIIELRIQIPEDQVEKLMADHRPYVRARLQEGEKNYQTVGIKLKGAAGSTRPYGEKPALTLNMDKYTKKQLFHELDKFHLNNSVQDETYLNEWFAWRFFREAGYPAARIAFAKVKINEKEEGIYILKEGFDARFLKQHFKDPSGNLYDGGFIQDIDAPLEKDDGQGPDDHSDLQAIVQACSLEDAHARWRAIDSLVDVPALIRFMAIERMLAHWDGYSVAANNYRIYMVGDSGKAVFLPHGMDQVIGELEMGLFEHTEPMLARSIMENDAWRRDYRNAVRELLPTMKSESIQQDLDRIVNMLQTHFQAESEEAGQAYIDLATEWKQRFQARIENIEKQLAEDEPALQAFDEKGRAKLADWYPAPEVEELTIDELDTADKKHTFHIACNGKDPCVASWRSRALLGQGSYVFVARCRTRNVLPLEEAEETGACIRISRSEAKETIQGTKGWTTLRHPFEVTEDQQLVEFVAELKASRGQVWFDAASMEIRRK